MMTQIKKIFGLLSCSKIFAYLKFVFSCFSNQGRVFSKLIFVGMKKNFLLLGKNPKDLSCLNKHSCDKHNHFFFFLTSSIPTFLLSLFSFTNSFANFRKDRGPFGLGMFVPFCNEEENVPTFQIVCKSL